MGPEQLRNILIKQCGLNPRKPVLAAVSGGPDSIFLLHHLHQANIGCVAAHLDHSLREGSAEEAEKVSYFCENLQIPLISERKDVGTFIKESRLSIEEGARILRYKFLFQKAIETDCQAVLVAHHADDQVETVVMHLLRGSGTRGLSGMSMMQVPNQWSLTIPLIRPILSVWREEIMDYCQEMGLSPIKDHTNADSRYFRNRIRNELIPQLITYNPQFKHRVLSMAEVIRTDVAYMESMLQIVWAKVVEYESKEYIAFNLEKLRILHPAMLRGILRLAFFNLNGETRDVDFSTVESACEFVMIKNTKNHLSLAGSLEIFCYLQNQVVIAQENDPLLDLCPQIEKDVPLTDSGEVQLNQRWRMIVSRSEGWKISDDPMECYLDEENLPKKLFWGRFKNGDCFEPLGMRSKSIKLGDFWTNAGLPSRARQNWPLLRTLNQIIWVPGFRIAEKYRITDKTKKIIHIEIRKEKSG